MEFRTTVTLPRHLPSFSHVGKIMMMGSCFAENIGNLLEEAKFSLDLNPFGILYNPLSIATALRRLLSGEIFQENELFQARGLWHSFLHHGSFSALTAEETLERINRRFVSAQERLVGCDWLVLTWGTAYVYRLQEDGRVVANCHKLPENRFNRQLLSVDEVVTEYVTLIQALLVLNPKLKILFTVSPIRHIRDGLHANQLSKATLLLAVERIQHLFPQEVFYFPSYEIVLDELRDYRFYADDMLHPSALAISYLWECFAATFFTPETKQIIASAQEIARDLAHKPFHPESEAYQRFLGQIVLKIERLNQKYPYLDFQNEKELCHIRLKP